MCKNEKYDKEKGLYMCKLSGNVCISREKGLMCPMFTEAGEQPTERKLRILWEKKKKARTQHRKE